MKRDILPKGLNHKDIWGSFVEAHEPAPCEHCGREATPKSLIASRKHWRMDLCSRCRHKKYEGTLGDPKHDIDPDDAMEVYGEKELPF